MTTLYEFSIHGRPILDTPFHLQGAGLPNVYLLNGVTIENDPDYGELITIEDLQNLHLAMGLSVVRRPRELTGDEMRFLRKQIGLTQGQLAKQLRVSTQTVANYEKGKTEKGPADVAVRFIYLAHVSPRAGIADACQQIARELVDASETNQKPIRMQAGQWSSGATHGNA